MSRHQRIPVTTAATLLTSPEGDASSGSSILMKNTGTVTVYIGSDTVDVANGYPLAVGEFITADLRGRRDDLYGRVATGSGEIRVLGTGV